MHCHLLKHIEPNGQSGLWPEATLSSFLSLTFMSSLLLFSYLEYLGISPLCGNSSGIHLDLNKVLSYVFSSVVISIPIVSIILIVCGEMHKWDS